MVDEMYRDPIRFTTNFNCSDGHYWTKDVTIGIQIIGEYHVSPFITQFIVT